MNQSTKHDITYRESYVLVKSIVGVAIIGCLLFWLYYEFNQDMSDAFYYEDGKIVFVEAKCLLGSIVHKDKLTVSDDSISIRYESFFSSKFTTYPYSTLKRVSFSNWANGFKVAVEYPGNILGNSDTVFYFNQSDTFAILHDLLVDKCKHRCIITEAYKTPISLEKNTWHEQAPKTQPAAKPTAKPGQTWKEPVTGMEYVWVPGWCYQMGCGSWTTDCSMDEKPVHEVCVDGFWMGKTEVTQGQWERVMRSNPSYFEKGGTYPVEQVSWDDAKAFIRKLESMHGGRYSFRLPTEAEWEYACRSGGKEEKFSGGSDASRVAWYEDKSWSSTHAVGTKAPNGLGLYDMSGNICEWCEDIYSVDAYEKHRRNNLINTSGGPNRVVRGGGWSTAPKSVRCADRSGVAPAGRNNLVGFRLVRSP